MSTGLTFGTISSLYGLSHGIIDQSQYSILVAGVIGSAVIPTLIANAFFLPKHLLPQTPELDEPLEEMVPAAAAAPRIASSKESERA
jgi:glutathione-regulated potassium-efflux system ancillary protein KefC